MDRRGRRDRAAPGCVLGWAWLISGGLRVRAGARPAGPPQGRGRALASARGAAQRRRLDL